MRIEPCQHRVQRPMVVLLHASAGSSRQWNELAEQLQPHFDVRAVDLHGHGAQPSWSGDGPFSLAHEARLVEPLLKQAGRVHLVGHSYGGAVALHLATAHPQRVASLTAFEPMAYHWLMDATPPSEHDCKPGPQQAALAMAGIAHVVGEALLRGDTHEAGRVFVDFWSGVESWQHMPDGQRDAVARRMRAVHQQFGAVFRARYSRGQLAWVPAPVLMLSGERTVMLTRRLAEELRAALPHAKHVTVPKAGHMGPVTHPEAVNALIAGFLMEQLDGAAKTSAACEVAQAA